jgi:hypothetical protein
MKLHYQLQTFKMKASQYTPQNDLVVNPHIEETPIIVEQGQIDTVTCSKKVSRILPTPVCKNNIL